MKTNNSNNKKVLKLTDFFGAMIPGALIKNAYLNNNCLYLGIFSLSEDEPGFYCDLTVNLSGMVPENCAYLDTNNFSRAEEFVRKNSLGTFTGLKGQSGFCTYPLYHFDPKRLEEVCCADEEEALELIEIGGE